MPSRINFSYITRGKSTDRPPCVSEPSSSPTLLAFTVGVEDSGWQPPPRVHVALPQELAAHGLSGPALEQHVVRDDS